MLGSLLYAFQEAESVFLENLVQDDVANHATDQEDRGCSQSTVPVEQAKKVQGQNEYAQKHEHNAHISHYLIHFLLGFIVVIFILLQITHLFFLL